MTTDPAPDETPDTRVIERMRRRVRALRALRGAVEYSLWAAALATLALLGARLGVVPASRARACLAVAALLPLAGAGLSALRRVPSLLAAQLLDRHYGLHDRLSSALEFRALPAGERTPWMAAAIDDAAEQARARTLDPSPALAWRWPPEAKAALGMLGLLALVAAAEFRVARVVATPRPSTANARDPLVLEDDDLQAFRDLSRELQRNAATPASRETLREFDRFLNDVSNRRLDRQEAYRRLAALQQTLDANQREDRDALRQTVQGMGERMGDRSDMAREVAQRLREGDLRRSQESMQRLADRLRQERGASEQQRQELQRALQRAAEQRNNEELRRQVEQARRDVEEMLRRQRERQLSQGEQDLLRRRQREAERLGRESEREQQLRREVEHLQRELSEAARDVMRDLQQAAQDVERGAEQLSRMEDERQSQQSLEELRQRLQDLRDQMRQQNGQNGQQQRMRLSRFSRAAGGRSGQGQRGQQGQQGGQQQGGNGQGGQQGGGGQQAGNGQGGQQGNGPGGQGGQGEAMQPGGGNGSQQGTLMVQQQGGVVVPMPGGQSQGGSPQQGGAQSGTMGSGAGTQHEENARGAPVATSRATQTMQIHGQQTGAGPSRSQVIRTAAQDGFASAPYRQVYSPYWDRAREVLHQGEVPPGYRSYVRRYFQLIRPRDEQ